MNKDKCHHCHCDKPLYECGCTPETVQIGCEHCGDPSKSPWPKNNEN